MPRPRPIFIFSTQITPSIRSNRIEKCRSFSPGVTASSPSPYSYSHSLTIRDFISFPSSPYALLGINLRKRLTSYCAP
jgi:hypothetical protein